MRVARRHVAAGADPSRHRATRARAARPLCGVGPGSELELCSFGGPGRVASVLRDALWYPLALPRRRAQARRPPLHDLPRPAAAARPDGVDRARPRDPSPSGGVPALASAVRESRAARSAARRARRRRGVGVHEAGGRRARRRSTRADPRRPQRGRPALHAGRAHGRGVVRPRGRDARAAEEPRPRRRGGAPCRRRAARRRRARVGRGGRRGLGRRGHRCGARRALPRRSLRPLPVAVRGVRVAGARGDGLRRPGRDLAGNCAGGGRGRRGGARRSARRRGDRRRNRAGRSAGEPSSSRSASPVPASSPGSVPPTRSRRSGGSSHDARRDRRRRSRARADRRRDVRRAICSASWRDWRRLRESASPRSRGVRSSFPSGWSPSSFARARRCSGWPSRSRGCCGGSAPTSCTRSTRSRCACTAPASSPSTTSRSNASPGCSARGTGSSFAASSRVRSRRAARVFTVSERTKRDLVELYGVPAEKVVVTPNGVDPAFHPAA